MAQLQPTTSDAAATLSTAAAPREASPPGFESAAKMEHLSEAEALRRHRAEVRSACLLDVLLACLLMVVVAAELQCALLRFPTAAVCRRPCLPPCSFSCSAALLQRHNCCCSAPHCCNPLQEDQERSELDRRLELMVPTTPWMNPMPNDALSDAALAAMAGPPARGEDSAEAPAAAARRQQVGAGVEV